MDELIFCFSGPEAQLLLDALVELPYKRVADLIVKIQRQAAEQLSGTVPKAPEPSEKPQEPEQCTQG